MYQQKQREQMNASSNFPGSSNSYTFASSNNGPNFAGSHNDPSPQNDPYLIRYGFSLRCNLDESSGKIQAKIENNGQERVEHAYRYDHKGHLTQVFVDGLQAEKYEFNSQGQRVLKLTKQRQNAIKYLYDDQGCLIQAGTTVFTYDQGGALASQQDGGRLMRFKYKETKLEQVILPDGAVIRYEYPDLRLYSAANQGAGPSAGQANTLPPNLPANPLGPMRKFKNNRLVAEYGWKNLFELNEYLDYELGLRYIFNYAQTNKQKNLGSKAGLASLASLETLASIAICALNQKPGSLKTLLSEPDGPGSQTQGQARGQTQGQARAQTLVCGCDQVGTPKLFTQPSGQRVKQIDYDSFGVVQYDTYPELFIPIGFAGGLVDRHTGLVRFGFRDYMPELGRFTCPDPLGDTGGDHDLYDYCVDDPVNMVDPEGLRGEALVDRGRTQGEKEEKSWREIADDCLEELPPGDWSVKNLSSKEFRDKAIKELGDRYLDKIIDRAVKGMMNTTLGGFFLVKDLGVAKARLVSHGSAAAADIIGSKLAGRQNEWKAWEGIGKGWDVFDEKFNYHSPSAIIRKGIKYLDERSKNQNKNEK